MPNDRMTTERLAEIQARVDAGTIEFDVIDTQTGEWPNLHDIALHEEWAHGLIYCDMEGFAIEEDGTLMLLDECGNQCYAPAGRFKVMPHTDVPDLLSALRSSYQREDVKDAAIACLTAELARVKQERDAAVEDIRVCMEEPCAACKYCHDHGDQFPCDKNGVWCGGNDWNWRGLCAKNAPEGSGKNG